jgi:hypothetical protein
MLLYHFGTRDGLLTTPAAAWSAFTGPLGRPYLRLFGRLHDTAGQPLALAVIRGLLMDLDATGDAARTHEPGVPGFLDTLAVPPPGHMGADYRCPGEATAVENGV